MASSAPTVPGTDPDPTDFRARPPRPAAPVRRAARRTAVLLVAAIVAAGVDDTRRDTPTGTPQPVTDRLAATIQQAQDRLRRLPGDAGTWAALGSAYVEQARVSGNPAYYAQAQGALERSLALQPTATPRRPSGWARWPTPGTTSPPPARTPSRRWRSNPASVEAHGVLADAATQLGDTATATAAVQRMLDLRPGVAAFTRASYELELHGRVDDARSALQRALAAATSRDELAFSHYYLGELAWGGGELAEAARPVRPRARRRPGRPDAAAGPGQGAGRRRPGRRGDHRLPAADRAGAAAAVPARVRRAAAGRGPAAGGAGAVPAARRAAAAARRAGLGRRRGRRRAGRRPRRPRGGGAAGRGRVAAPAEHLLRRRAGLGAARGRPRRRGAAADRAGRGARAGGTRPSTTTAG